jgi:hypothetical protein
MRVIGKDIGTAIEPMYQEIEARLLSEAEYALRIEQFEGEALSDVDWRDSGTVVIALHSGVPTRALAHALGVALQHVRQTLDHYPNVIPGSNDFDGGPTLRHALRELVLAPEAESHLTALGLDMEWEVKQRHAGMKGILRQATKEWDTPNTPDHAFGAMLYARFELDHPEEMWAGLKKDFVRKLPAVAESGEGVAQLVRESGWDSIEACIQSLVAVRDEMGMIEIAAIEDRRDGTLL